jgi:cytidyltransferase-like protein
MKIVLVTGGFDPIHSGHIKYLKAAKALGDELVVGLNSDEWLARKKGQAFMPYDERMSVVGNLHCVDWVINFDDEDGSAKHAIYAVREKFPGAEIIFANGGDRTQANIPEMDVEDDNLTFEFGVGGEDKANSSSWILQEWKAPKTERSWGYYRVLHEVAGTKVKELTINPGQKLSMQRHKDRAEHWHVTEGMCQVDSQMPGGYYLPPKTLSKHMTLDIPAGEWHQLANPYEVPCKLVEIQYGPRCDEDDIERR